MYWTLKEKEKKLEGIYGGRAYTGSCRNIVEWMGKGERCTQKCFVYATWKHCKIECV